MHDGIRLTYLGLTDLEVRVLKSIFSLAPQLKEDYTLISPQYLDQADLILVNADDPATIRQWSEIRSANKLVSSLLLTDNAKMASGENTIQRPIRVQKLIAALQRIVDQTSTGYEDTQPASGIDILVVDDSFPVRRYMEHKLGELSATPIAMAFAANGEEAIAQAAKQRYDIIFLDVMMEGLDGYKVCKTIKSAREAYIVMLTSKKSPFDKVRGTMSGCDAYLTKPPEDSRLAEELKKCLARRGIPAAPAPDARAG